MMVAMESWVKVVFGRLRRVWAEPGVKRVFLAVMWLGAGFLAGGARVGSCPVPAGLALQLGLGGRRGLWVCLGSLLGYRTLWRDFSAVGLLWALGGGLLGALDVKDLRLRCALGAALASGVGLWAVWSGQGLPLPGYLAGVLLVLLAPRLGTRPSRVGRWLLCGLAVLTLGRLPPLALGAASALAVGASFPAAVLGGLGLDLAAVTPVPMAGLLAISWMARFLPGPGALRALAPGAAYGVWTLLLGSGDYGPAFPLLAGGAVGLLIPPGAIPAPKRGSAGAAQVKLELAAGVLGDLQRSLACAPVPVIDREALLGRVRSRACGSCPARSGCLEQARLTTAALEDPVPFPCRKSGRLRWELLRSREQLRLLQGEHRRREEYRGAVLQQLGFLSAYLKDTSDQLTGTWEAVHCRYTLNLGVRTRGRGHSNGDRWAAFPGSRGRFYLALCDGMGTGLGAQQEGKEALDLLTAMLKAGLPPDRALGTLNSLLTLSGRAGAVTVDLAELRLDTGQARLYKWGAAPSLLLQGYRTEVVGSPTAPPGLSITRRWRRDDRVSLSHGEKLILLSDGVDQEEARHRAKTAPEAPPGELAARLLEGAREDDATVAVVCLRRKLRTRRR